MVKLIAYPLTVIYFLCFGLTLVIFHPIQWFCFNVFGYKAHKISVDALQFFLIRCLNVLGTRITFNNPHSISTEHSLIVVSNHQSMYDISPIMWYMRKHHIKFVSKKELGKGIPSVSYNLRHGGSVLIDRKNPRQAIVAISKFSKYIASTNRAAVIFPEGTRSKDGAPKKFQNKGLITLFKGIPNAYVVPITINNSWKLLRYGKFPMGIGVHVKFKVHSPIKIDTFADPQELANLVEKTITEDIQY
ncbi:lysophospholipid acyltransferase family protein [Winogradskyella immobilis]|uniref:1-acyl-sn-glycerol-3-phosphate acyltransferase n=1 Tax=Winogradskyella immobilis TaxID=2816852 RepID=A0ABS8EQC9_9FLAO|nr:lysophospholipid acyltransferase family protein [Winogradskyella immobilis]MCC1485211.1 1-acyl-sn-glycerol-3-phosphate acyltransferase [Winogradskyella immobilis]MCG0017303.1 1-acyl-sn-glycerol-3-phosphate acyltransferase [Winogradskyella immobilis]